MNTIHYNDIVQLPPCVATIGFFDGVHRGHQFLIHHLVETARKDGLQSTVITFDAHPRKVLQADYQPEMLSTLDSKLLLLSKTEVDNAVVLHFDKVMAAMSAREFMQQVLHDHLNVRKLFIGYDHRFGHNREDSFEQYVTYGKNYGIRVIKASQYSEGEAAVSSSEIRKLLAECRVEEAAHLLTYPYGLRGSIVSGYKVGRKLGFPTANIQVDEPFKIIPGIGVYAVRVYLNEQRYKGMLYIGNRPTLDNGDNITLEVNILNFSGDIYNNEITVAFIQHVRGDIKFNSLDQLIDQLKKDRETVDRILTE